ncbi:MAG: hypothetical protein PHQ54_02520 [Candidatus Omnitrophica bacterium]|nr:hypothetical protein [Candidatus Omnitrophota bacterium]
MIKSSFFKVGLLLLALPVLWTQLYLDPASENITRRARTQEPVLITAKMIEERADWGYQDGGAQRGVVSLPEHNAEHLVIFKRSGSFSKHLVIKLLDEYFLSLGKYSYPHINAPLAFDSQSGEYYEIGVKGQDGFIWEDPVITYKLKEFDSFCSAFSQAGVSVGADITTSDDGRVSQNIILTGPTELSPEQRELLDQEARYYGRTIHTYSEQWVRIDFVGRSCPVNDDQLKFFLKQNQALLQDHLGWKFRLLELASRPVLNPLRYEGLNPSEQDEFNRLLARYQREALQNLSR